MAAVKGSASVQYWYIVPGKTEAADAFMKLFPYPWLAKAKSPYTLPLAGIYTATRSHFIRLDGFS